MCLGGDMHCPSASTLYIVLGTRIGGDEERMTLGHWFESVL